MCLAQGPQHSDTGEARARGPSVSSQAHYHWATALPACGVRKHLDSVDHDYTICPGLSDSLCLFDLIYVSSTIFQLYRDGSSWVEPVLS